MFTLKIMVAAGVLAFLPKASIEAETPNWPGKRLPTLIERWEAELIVFGEVVETQFKDGGQYSRIKVISKIKSGEREIGEEVKVFVQLGSHWPYTFRNKTTAIAYLKYSKKLDCYVDYNQRDGGIDVDQDTGKFLVKQYAKLPKILKEKKKLERAILKRDWYFDLSLDPKTRGHAAYGIWYLWRNTKDLGILEVDEAETVSDWLTESQKEAICDVIASEKPDWSAYEMIKLLKAHPSRKIDKYMLKALRQSLTDDEMVPVGGSTIADLSIDLLPERMGFVLSESLTKKHKAHYDALIDFSYEIDIGDEYTEEQKQAARTAITKQWRELAREFLEIPEIKSLK